jgi:hypothetical protein
MFLSLLTEENKCSQFYPFWDLPWGCSSSRSCDEAGSGHRDKCSNHSWCHCSYQVSVCVCAAAAFCVPLWLRAWIELQKIVTYLSHEFWEGNIYISWTILDSMCSLSLSLSLSQFCNYADGYQKMHWEHLGDFLLVICPPLLWKFINTGLYALGNNWPTYLPH